MLKLSHQKFSHWADDNDDVDDDDVDDDVDDNDDVDDANNGNEKANSQKQGMNSWQRRKEQMET